MKKRMKTLSIFMVISLIFGGLLLTPDAVMAKKAQKIRFVIVGGAEGAPEASAEAMALNMYLGALDYRLRTFNVLKGKYELKYINTLFSDANECLTGVASGAAEMTFSGPHYLEQIEPSWKLGSAPGVFESWDHFMRTMSTPAWKALH